MVPRKAMNEAQSKERIPVYHEDETRNLAFICAVAAYDKKAEQIRVLDVSEVSGFTDYFVICSAMNERQVVAICDQIEDQMRIADRRPLCREGYSEGRWVLMDYGEIVIHVFLDPLRDYYNLETLWAQAEVVKLPPELFAPAGKPLN